MTLKRIIGAGTAAIAITAAAVLYTAHPVKSSDHQDTYNLANAVGHNTSADITDVFVFPSPSNPNNVVFAMNVSPLIGAGMGTTKFFDPTLMWQFKIAHGATNYQEDQVLQLGVTGVDSTQTITLYGPSAPNEVGTTNTFVKPTGSFGYNNATTVGTGASAINVFAGPRADPFRFDLFAFFSFFGDRAFDTHNSQQDPGPAANGPVFNEPAQPGTVGNKFATTQTKAQRPDNPSFAGFQAGDTAGATSALGNYACNNGPAQNALTDLGGGFNVLSYVIEVPKSLLYGPGTPFSSSVIHVWATSNSSTTNS
ncbi:MAG: hypothetical protein NVSMB19_25810 [Vulcanimicrobiaceae bacterium]